MDTTETYILMCQKAFPEDAKEGKSLKTQDQLQKMIGDYEKCIDLIGWYNEMNTPDIGQFEPSSMEQLWLAFVMSEKYHRIWSSEKEEWIKQRQGKEKSGLNRGRERKWK